MLLTLSGLDEIKCRAYTEALIQISKILYIGPKNLLNIKYFPQ
jgi:hypothetical protein